MVLRVFILSKYKSFYLHITSIYAAFDKFNSSINAVYKHKNTVVITQISSLKQNKA